MSYEAISDDDWEPMHNMAFELSELISSEVYDEKSGPSIEERELRSIYIGQLGILERKYGPHPWLIDIRADATEEPEERIRLRLEGLSLVDEKEFELRGQFYVDLARDYLDELGDKSEATKWLIQARGLVHKLGDNKDLIQKIEDLDQEVGGQK